jgi:ubiquinol-cytochrome c reductase iron-sulfur subunit
MNEDIPKEGGNSGSGADVPHASDQVVEEQAPARRRTNLWLSLGAILSWRIGKKFIHALFGGSSAGSSQAEQQGGEPRFERQQGPGLIPSRGWRWGIRLPAAREICEELSGASSEHGAGPDARSSSPDLWGTFLALVFFAASVCGAIGFVFFYWTGGDTQVLGGCLALFLAGMAFGLIISAHRLSETHEVTEEREELESPPEERAAAALNFHCGAATLGRRGLLKWMSTVGFGAVAAIGISVLRSIFPNPDQSIYEEVWKRGQRLMTADGKPVKADALAPGSTTIVFPEDRIGQEKAQTVLVRVQPQFLELPRDRANWAPMGNLAFSRICTHAGCPVGMYEKTSHLLMCPCHQSTFDVLNSAQPTGGPAARALPQLPLYVDADGALRAGSGFTQPPGPGFWGMLS